MALGADLDRRGVDRHERAVSRRLAALHARSRLRRLCVCHRGWLFVSVQDEAGRRGLVAVSTAVHQRGAHADDLLSLLSAAGQTQRRDEAFDAAGISPGAAVLWRDPDGSDLSLYRDVHGLAAGAAHRLSADHLQRRIGLAVDLAGPGQLAGQRTDRSDLARSIHVLDLVCAFRIWRWRAR